MEWNDKGIAVACVWSEGYLLRGWMFCIVP